MKSFVKYSGYVTKIDEREIYVKITEIYGSLTKITNKEEVNTKILKEIVTNKREKQFLNSLNEHDIYGIPINIWTRHNRTERVINYAVVRFPEKG
jgi:hypothetical protein